MKRVSATYELTIEDVRAFRRRRRAWRLSASRWRPWLTVLLYGLGGAFAAATLWLELRRGHPATSEITQDAFFAGGGLMVALVLLIGVNERRRNLQRADARTVAQGPVELLGDDERLEVRQADLSNGYPWTRFLAIEETPSHVFLFLGPESAIVVPRAAVAGTAMGALLAEKARPAAPAISQ